MFGFFVVYVYGLPKKEGRDLAKKIKIGMRREEVWEVFGGSPSFITGVHNKDEQFWWYGEGAKQGIVNKAHGNNGTTYIWLLFNIGNLLDKRVIN